MKSIILQISLIVLLFFSCKKIVSNNPFDSECPKYLFTPTSFQGSQTSNGIEFNWSINENNISGYKLLKNIDNGIPIVLAVLSKDSTHFCDTSLILGKSHKYSLVAYAENNESNLVNFEITPVLVVKTITPTFITTNSATFSGLATIAPGTVITSNGFSWRTLNSNSTSTTGQQGGAGVFNLSITNLLPNTTYIYRAYARTNQNLLIFGKEISFTTSSLSIANLTTLVPNKITSSFATIGGNITYDGGSTITESGIVYSTSQNPTINSTKIINTSGNNNFTSIATGLNPLTTYYVRAYAINNQGVAYGNQVSFTTTARTVNTGSVSDIDGNSYGTVTIGTQVWMKENLKTTKYNNGILIPNVTDSAVWNNLTSGAYCWYNNSIVNKPIYGALYNYYAINTENICPVGWHVPSDAEWDVLVTFLGGNSVAAGKLREAGTSHWISPNTGATNSSGFTALPSGARLSYAFNGLTNSGLWWSTTLVISNNPSYIPPAWNFTLSTNSSYKGYSIKNDGNAVRCVGN